MVAEGKGSSLCDAEELLPEVLGSRYSSGAFGKWHLSDAHDPFDSQAEGYPWVNGFDHFEGQLHAVQSSYCATSGALNWLEVESSPTLVVQPPDLTGYLVEEHFRDAQAWIQSAPQPWFCYLAPQAPFHLSQWPPQQYTACSPVVPSDSCTTAGGGSVPQRAAYDATLEAADSFLADLLDQLDQQAAQIHPSFHWWNTTTIFLLADNGTPGPVARLPFNNSTAKETLFEGGVRIPFIVAGWGVAPSRWGRHSAELVNTVDVFATVCGLARVPLPQHTLDGVNLGPYLRARPVSGLRTFSYAEKWSNSKGVCWEGGSTPDRVYRSTTYGVNWKIHFAATPLTCVFYDLASDPCEQVPFLWGDPVVQQIQAGLWAEVAALVDKATCDSLCQ
jgi:arylsulfatase